MSLIFPFAIAFGIGVGIVLARQGKPREAGLGIPLPVALVSFALIWVLEGFISIGGLGHYGPWIFVYGLLFGALAAPVYLASYVLTRVVCDRAFKRARGEP